MTERRWHKKISMGLVLFLIISLCSSYTIAQTQTLTNSIYGSMDKQQIDAPMPIDYVLFSGSQTTDLDLRRQEVSISGNIHSNAGIKIGAGRFNMNGICESVKGHETYGSPEPKDTTNFIDNGSVIKIPDISDEIIDAAFINGKKVIHIYPSEYKIRITQPNISIDFRIGSGFVIEGPAFTVENDEIYFFHGDVIFTNGVKNGDIIASGDIKILYSFNTSNGYASLYSTNGNIIYDCITKKLNASFYAPNGNVIFYGPEVDITGRIVAETISLSCSSIKITAPTDNNPKDIVTPTSIPSPTPAPISISKAADVNADKVVNMSDVIIMASVFNSSKGDGVYVEYYDLNSDGVINMNDIIVIAKNFNTIISD